MRDFGPPPDLSDNGIDLRMPIWPFVVFGGVVGIILALTMALT